MNETKYGVSIKSLYNFKNLLHRQMKRQISGNYYKMRRIYLSFFLVFFASFSIPLYGHHQLHEAHQDCTRFLTRSMFSSDVLGRPLLPLSNTVPVSINFLCHARTDGPDGGSLSYLVLKFRRVCRSDLVSNKARYTLCLLLRSGHFLRGSFNSILFINVIKTLTTTEYMEQRYLVNCLRRQIFEIVNFLDFRVSRIQVRVVNSVSWNIRSCLEMTKLVEVPI